MTERAKYWQRMLSAWEASGLSQAEFCRRRGLTAVTFSWWKRQLLGPTRGSGRGRRRAHRVHVGSSQPSFVEVSLPSGGAGAGRPATQADPIAGRIDAGYEVAFPCGTSIRLPSDFDVDKASELIRAARSC